MLRFFDKILGVKPLVVTALTKSRGCHDSMTPPGSPPGFRSSQGGDNHRYDTQDLVENRNIVPIK